MFLRNRRQYYYYRTVVLLNLIAALLTFMLFPVASPFAIPGAGLMDTIQAFGPAIYGSDTMAIFTTPRRRCPACTSVGQSSWESTGGVPSPGVQGSGPGLSRADFVCDNHNGNHFILDAIVGGSLAALSFGAVEGYRAVAARVRIEDVRASRSAFLRKMKQLQISRTFSR